MSDQGRYSMVIEWSEEDRVYVVSLPEWGDLVHTHGETYEDAVQKGKELIDGLVDMRTQRGDPLPKPHVFAGV